MFLNNLEDSVYSLTTSNSHIFHIFRLLFVSLRRLCLYASSAFMQFMLLYRLLRY